MSMKKPSKHKQFIEAAFVSLVLAVLLFSIAPRSQAVFTSPTASLIAPPSLGGSSLFTQSQASSIAIQPTAAPTTDATPSTAASTKTSSSQSGSTVSSIIGALTGMKPFGGKITVIHPNICGGMAHFTVLSATGGTVNLMADAGTITYLEGPASSVGQNVLGLYVDTVVTCSPTRFTSYSGGRVFMMGTSKP